MFSHFSSRLPLLALLFAAVVMGFAQQKPLPGLSGPPITWPVASQPRLTYALRTTVVDGTEMTYADIKGPGIKWETELASVWRVADTPGRYALRLEPKFDLPCSFGIAIFGQKDFLPELDQDTWQRYLAGLTDTYGKKLEILAEHAFFTPGSNWRPVMGQKTCDVLFRYPVDEKPSRAEAQVFFFRGNQLIVFVLSGNADFVEKDARHFFQSVGSFVDRMPLPATPAK